MREDIKFHFFRGFSGAGSVSNCLPEDVFDACVERWPEFKKKGKATFDVVVEAQSQKAEEIIEFIRERAGKVPNWKRFPAVYDDENRYQLFGERHFEKQELAQADYFWCIPQKEIAKSGYRHDDGRIEVERGSIMAQPVGTTANGFTVLCIDAFRQELEKESFVNIEFKPVLVSGKKPPKEPLWELSGKKQLPPVANRLVNDQGEEPDESARGCWVDDLFFPTILTYTSKTLADVVESFDVAVTAERWHSGIIARRSPFLICSRRFRAWCQNRGLKLNWVPVQVKDESHT
jgi:hypothetical protein